MPRLVDHAARDAEIAAASLRVLERDGLTGLSVRRVAEEADVAPASLRRMFPTQHALRERCLTLIEERTVARIAALTSTGRARVLDMLAQLLPLDSDRRTELIAQVQLGMLARTDRALRPAATRLDAAVTHACRAAIEQLILLGELAPERDSEFEIQRLRALLDGLAMGALWTSAAPDAARMLDVLRRHFDELGRP